MRVGSAQRGRYRIEVEVFLGSALLIRTSSDDAATAGRSTLQVTSWRAGHTGLVYWGFGSVRESSSKRRQLTQTIRISSPDTAANSCTRLTTQSTGSFALKSVVPNRMIPLSSCSRAPMPISPSPVVDLIHLKQWGEVRGGAEEEHRWTYHEISISSPRSSARGSAVAYVRSVSLVALSRGAAKIFPKVNSESTPNNYGQ